MMCVPFAVRAFFACTLITIGLAGLVRAAPVTLETISPAQISQEAEPAQISRETGPAQISQEAEPAQISQEAEPAQISRETTLSQPGNEATVAEVSLEDQAGEESEALWQQILDAAYANPSVYHFKGDFVYFRNKSIETFRVSYRNEGGSVTEQVEVLSGPSDVRRSNRIDTQRLFSIDGGIFNRQVTFKTLRKNKLPWHAIEQQYVFDVQYDHIVAGREVIVVGITPRNADRYRFRVAIDRETGLFLSREVFDLRDQLVEKMMFVDISVFEVDTPDRAEGTAPAHNSPVDLPAAGLPAAGSPANLPASAMPPAFESIVSLDQLRLPPGFYLRHHAFEMSEEIPVEHLLFTDDLVALSVYVELRPQTREHRHGHMKFGSVSLCYYPLGDHSMVLVGEMPMKTLTSIAKSIQPKNALP